MIEFFIMCLYNCIYNNFNLLLSKALKQYNQKVLYALSEEKQIQNEIEILKSIDNNYILKYLDFFYVPSGFALEIFLVTEYCQVNII
jgi:serine/threonine protein kinase